MKKLMRADQFIEQGVASLQVILVKVALWGRLSKLRMHHDEPDQQYDANHVVIH